MIRIVVAALCLAVLAIGTNVRAADAGPKVVSVITVDTHGHYEDWLVAHKRARKIYARIDSGKRRLLRDSTSNDIVYVIAEFENEKAMKDAAAARIADSEMAALIKEGAGAPWKTLSNKLWIDVTPSP